MSNYLLQILMNFFSRSIKLAPLCVVTEGILVSVGRDIARDTRVSIDMPDTTDIRFLVIDLKIKLADVLAEVDRTAYTAKAGADTHDADRSTGINGLLEQRSP